MSDVCAVCLESHDQSSTALPCGHRFHCVCMINAFRRQSACPVCRADVAGLVPHHSICYENLADSLEVMLEDVLRQNRTQSARRNAQILRVRRENPHIEALSEAMNAHLREQRRLERLLKKEETALWKTVRESPQVVSLRRSVKNARARVERARRKYTLQLEQRLGSAPRPGELEA